MEHTFNSPYQRQVNTMNVYLIDDDSILLRSLTHLMQDEGYQVHSYLDAESFLADVNFDLKPACILLDLRMPNISGVELFFKIQHEIEHWSTIFLTGHGEVHTAVEMIKNGAFEFLQKPIEIDALLTVVDKAMKNSEFKTKIKRITAQLTEREQQILKYLTLGFSTKEISSHVDISIKTVEFHRANIRQKISLKDYKYLMLQA